MANDPQTHWLFEDPPSLLSLSGDCLPGSLSYSSADEVAMVINNCNHTVLNMCQTQCRGFACIISFNPEEALPRWYFPILQMGKLK